MKTFTFTTNKKNNTFNFRPTCKSTNYSKILDDLILDNIKKTNPYLNMTTGSAATLKSDDFAKAAKFLANYNKMKNIPFIFGKVYKLSDGSSIIFYEDEIQIDHDLYSYDDFDNFDFINALSEPKKKLIIDIFAYGKHISIKL